MGVGRASLNGCPVVVVVPVAAVRRNGAGRGMSRVLARGSATDLKAHYIWCYTDVMPALLPLTVAIDTNVLFEGLTRRHSASTLVIDAWLSGLLDVVISNALAYEYFDVLTRKLSLDRWRQIEPVLSALLDQARWTAIHFSWRPNSPDPADEHVIDLALNGNAAVVTANVADFRRAALDLGLMVLQPVDLVQLLSDRLEQSQETES